ncbi:MAG: V-type ATP synthase subunit E family protein [Candidatus Aureabacteria bacterium]|nr:V-type ATP synthase subunit E family protein [Candidatus Auribacterota bacterium]
MNQAVERIQQAVRAEAGAEAARLRAEAQRQLDQLVSGCRREEEEKGRAAATAERARCEQIKFREISRAQRQARLDELAARNNAIDRIFQQVREEVLKLTSAHYKKLLLKWLGEPEAAEGGELIPSQRDEKVMAEILTEINAARPREAQFVLSKTRATFHAGFALRTPRYEITRSLDGWLDEKKREMAPRLEKELFGA